ncbi:hypothetical protein OG738_21630 [Amycolatopsis sp. NBC_01488]|uniref:hotdog domain-containing protein n=1 Tax=Amycolatopsis sp. NBC_01488 TaxID=2903563 RepID=UPI002E284A4F|nr:hotdog domain-containing protein [Amycolatopsis sp. NBC_01488]
MSLRSSAPDTTRVTDRGRRAGTRHRHETVLRFADLDWQGRTNNVSMVGNLQEAQIWLLDPDRRKIFQDADESFVGAANNVDYLRPLRFREEPITVEATIVELSRSKVLLGSDVVDDRYIYADTHRRHRRCDHRGGAARLGSTGVRTIDLDGHAILAGLIDAHVHCASVA